MDQLPQIEPCCCGPADESADTQPCCGGESPESAAPTAAANRPWIVGRIDTPVGEVPLVGTTLELADRLGSWKARWGVGRMGYQVAPGLYAVGEPTPEDPVLVTANYKMTFDRLRKELGGLSVWILVLETQGINVWCAAGKGTFGTDELVGRIEATRLAEVVSHKRLVVPQLGAPGIAAHRVRERSGFRVTYGPVRAADLPEFLSTGMRATPEMREVDFPLAERVALIPMELVPAMKPAVPLALCFMLASGLGPDGYSISRVLTIGLWSAALLLGACVWSVTLTPALLPWLPGRAFSVKGLWVGIAFVAVVFAATKGIGPLDFQWTVVASWTLIILAASSFLAMNFTGSSTYTSLSGVRREMRRAVPLQAAGALVGVALWLVGRFV